MIRTLIVDDEPWARTTLRLLLGEDAEIELIGECGSGMAAVKAIEELRPDLLFLDIQMADIDGFELLERVSGGMPQAVIFVTAYDQFALKAFEVAALDYLLKPFDNERFYRALGRAKDTLQRQVKTVRLMVRNAGRVAFLKACEIDWIDAADYYACLHVAGKQHMLRKPLAELERELDAEGFCRIHRSHIVNLERVREVRASLDGEFEVLLKDGKALRLSRSYRAALLERLRAVYGTSGSQMALD